MAVLLSPRSESPLKAERPEASIPILFMLCCFLYTNTVAIRGTLSTSQITLPAMACTSLAVSSMHSVILFYCRSKAQLSSALVLNIIVTRGGQK